VDQRVIELHCIMPLANLGSVLTHGILSYERASKLQHCSVAMQPVQDRRDRKQVPGGLRLHQYANLYFHARNPMLFKRLDEAEALCVLRISTEVFTLQGTVISDRNAASDYVRFFHPSQWKLLDFDAIYAMDWRDSDRALYFRRKSYKCAEVLVPHCIAPNLLLGAYVLDAMVRARLLELDFSLPIGIDPVLFFQQASGA
jgi:hypothetical protein